MDTKEQVGKAQRSILEHLAGFEDTLAALYATFAEQLQPQKAFWEKLSREEREHARVLRGLDKTIDRGFLFYNIGRFHLDTIAESIAKLEHARRAALEEGFDIHHACKIATEAEASVLDGEFYAIVKSDAPEFQIIAEHLADATQKHSNQVRALLVATMESERKRDKKE